MSKIEPTKMINIFFAILLIFVAFWFSSIVDMKPLETSMKNLSKTVEKGFDKVNEKLEKLSEKVVGNQLVDKQQDGEFKTLMKLHELLEDRFIQHEINHKSK